VPVYQAVGTENEAKVCRGRSVARLSQTRTRSAGIAKCRSFVPNENRSVKIANPICKDRNAILGWDNRATIELPVAPGRIVVITVEATGHEADAIDPVVDVGVQRL
jgi:hypothetical protein